MAEIILDSQSAPETPASGKLAIYPESSLRFLSARDENGYVHKLNRRTNFSTVAQSFVGTIGTYIVGSKFSVSPEFLSLTAVFKWRISLTKTAAGSGASTFALRLGPFGTISDISIVSVTKQSGTAAIDEAWIDLFAVQRLIPPGTQQTRAFSFALRLVHNLNTTGHATVPFLSAQTTSAVFNEVLVNQIIGLSFTQGPSDATTMQMVQSEAYNV